jgi:CrcB protein
VTGPSHPLRLAALAAVALGGVVGASLRWELARSFPASPTGFPWTTFWINVTGSALLALLPALAFVRRHPLVAPALGTGVLGGFTTLSAYSEESRALLAGGHLPTAAAYVLGTVVAALAGVALADRFSGPAERGEFVAEDGDL